MKKVSFILVSLLIIFSTFSCNSLVLDDAPSWVTSRPRALGYVVYVGVGRAENSENAKDEAYNDVLVKLSKDLGYDVSQRYLRDLMITGRIPDLDARVRDTWEAEDQGTYLYYIELFTPTSSLEASRSVEYQNLLLRENAIKTLLDEALTAYKNNEDILAVEKILEALNYSLVGNVNNPDYTPSSILKRAAEILSNISLSFRKEKDNTPEVEVKVKRTKGLFHPNVVNGLINCSYRMENNKGELSNSSFIAKTNDKGVFYFNKTNPYMVRHGSVRFSVYIKPELIHQIRDNGGEEYLATILSLVDKSEIVHSYREEVSFNQRDLVVAVAEYDIDGNIREKESTLKAFTSYLDKANVKGIEIVQAEDDEAEDIFYSLLSSYPDKKYFIVIRVGITDIKENNNSYFVKTEGRMALYDRVSEESFLVHDTFALGNGITKEEAEDEALKVQARIIASLLLDEV